MTGLPLKVISPDVLEIKGAYPSSPTIYVRVENIQGFLVNHRLSTIELYTSGVPVKVIDCSSAHISGCVELLSQFLTKKSKTLEDVSERLTELESRVYSEIPLDLSDGSAQDAQEVEDAQETQDAEVEEEAEAEAEEKPVEKEDHDETCLDICASTVMTMVFVSIVCNGMYYMNRVNLTFLESF
jgi:hypothetical protein